MNEERRIMKWKYGVRDRRPMALFVFLHTGVDRNSIDFPGLAAVC